MQDTVQCIKCLAFFKTHQELQVHIQTCLTQEQNLLLGNMKSTNQTQNETFESNFEVLELKKRKTKEGKRHKKKKIHGKNEKYTTDKDGNKVKKTKKKHKLGKIDKKERKSKKSIESCIQDAQIKIKEEPGGTEGIKASKPLSAKKKARPTLFNVTCPVCDMHFTRANRYINHLKSHAGNTFVNSENDNLLI